MKNLLAASVVTCAVLYGLLAVVLCFVCVALELPVAVSFFTCAAVIVIQFLISPFLTDLVQKWLYKTRFDAQVPAYLDRFIDEVCAQNNMKRPRMGFIDDGAPNAFTYGHTKNDARIVLTRGIFDLLDEEEVKAVVAHELGHAVHYDMLLMTMVQLVPMVLYGVYSVCNTAVRHSGSSSNNNSQAALGVVALVAYVLYIITEYLILWLSRTREYFADQFSAQTTRNPGALASALVNIGFGLSTREKSKDAKTSASMSSTIGIFDTKNSKSMVVSCYKDGKVDPAGIKSAMKWELWNVWAFWYEIGSTHPLVSKRLIALSDMAPEFGQKPFVNFDEKKPESYVDDFARELFIDVMPIVGFIALLVVGIVTAMAAETADAMVQASLPWFAGSLVAGFALSCLKYLYTHPSRSYSEANVQGLLGEVKVSMVKSVPCELRGTLIGRGDPGCVFNEDYVLQDETGIIFLDYNQPLWIINKVFALFKSKENINRDVVVRGWYRRNMVPFVELYSMTIDGKTKKCYSYGFGWAWRLVLLAISIALLILVFVGL